MNPTNHKILKTRTDTWLTPPYVLEALGKFDIDPCCPPKMPWKTAKQMWVQPLRDGLRDEWGGDPEQDMVQPTIQESYALGY